MVSAASLNFFHKGIYCIADLSVLSTSNNSADTYKNRLAKLIVYSYSQNILTLITCCS